VQRAELLNRGAGQNRGSNGARRSAAGQIEHRPKLAEVAPRTYHRHVLHCAITLFAQDLDFPGLNHIDQVTGVSLAEKELPFAEPDLSGFSLGCWQMGSHLDDLVGELRDALVVSGHHDHPTGAR